MDFSTEFVALRDRLIETQDKAFRTQTNVEVAGRMAALCSSFTIKSARKILGLMPTGGVGHAHEYRLLFAVPKRLKKLAHEQQFEGGKHGWGSVRMACVDLEAHKLCVSRMGDSLKNIMKAVL